MGDRFGTPSSAIMGIDFNAALRSGILDPSVVFVYHTRCLRAYQPIRGLPNAIGNTLSGKTAVVALVVEHWTT